MSNQTYDVLARIQRLALPFLSAIFTFCVVMGETWGFTLPVEQIAATLTALDALLGTVLAILNAQYKKAIAAAATESDIFEMDSVEEDDQEEGIG